MDLVSFDFFEIRQDIAWRTILPLRYSGYDFGKSTRIVAFVSLAQHRADHVDEGRFIGDDAVQDFSQRRGFTHGLHCAAVSSVGTISYLSREIDFPE